MKKRIGWLLSHVVLFASIVMLNGCGVDEPPPPELPELPISLSFRKAEFGKGLVAQFTNKSDRYLKIAVDVINTTTKNKHAQYIEVGPNQYQEIGWAEGWSFASGEWITLTLVGYKKAVYKVP